MATATPPPNDAVLVINWLNANRTFPSEAIVQAAAGESAPLAAAVFSPTFISDLANLVNQDYQRPAAYSPDRRTPATPDAHPRPEQSLLQVFRRRRLNPSTTAEEPHRKSPRHTPHQIDGALLDLLAAAAVTC